MKFPNYRQGELAILGNTINQNVNIAELKKRGVLTVVKDGCIREGETSGHKHEVKNGELLLFKDKATGEEKMIVDAKKGTTITHPEHAPIAFDKKGKFEIKVQNEYKPGEKDGQKAKVKD
jgi:hypothetical protein